MKDFIKLCAIALLFAYAPNVKADNADQDVAAWALSRMQVWSPPGTSDYPNARETAAAGTARYKTIVSDAMAVAYDPSEVPIFSGTVGRARTLALMLAIAHSESGFRKDVDFGIGHQAVGDGGRSWCLMQIQAGLANPATHKTHRRIALKGDTYEYTTDPSKGYGGEDLVSNRQACFRVALHMIRESFRICSSNRVEDRLAIYAGGRCDLGHGKSEYRVWKAMHWLRAAPPPADDAAVMAAMSASSSGPSASND